MMLEHVLFKSAYLFSIYVLITSRNMIKALMCLELVLKLILSSICFEVKHCSLVGVVPASVGINGRRGDVRGVLWCGCSLGEEV